MSKNVILLSFHPHSAVISCFSPLASCSKTESSSAGTWTLNVLWKMCGIDVHMDPNIGKRLNALGNTLTSLTGEEDVDDIADLNSVNMADLSDEDEADTMSPTIHMVSHPVSFYLGCRVNDTLFPPHLDLTRSLVI